MVERVAGAVAPIIEGDNEIYWASEYGRPIPFDSVVAIARAAIQALLEPDEGMLDAWASAVPYWGEEAIRKGFRAMLLPLVEPLAQPAAKE